MLKQKKKKHAGKGTPDIVLMYVMTFFMPVPEL